MPDLPTLRRALHLVELQQNRIEDKLIAEHRHLRGMFWLPEQPTTSSVLEALQRDEACWSMMKQVRRTIKREAARQSRLMAYRPARRPTRRAHVALKVA